MDGLSFASPYALLALAAVPLLLLFLAIVRHGRSRFTVAFTNLDVLTAVLRRRRRHRRRRWLPLIAILLSLTILALGLAQPRIRLSNTTHSTTIALLVDVSASMESYDIRPTRLQAAVTAMHEFVHVLPANEKVGLVTFSDKVEVLAAPTTDHAAVNSRLNVLSPQGGTALGQGVVAAVKLLTSTLAAQGVRHTPGSYLPAAIVLESDGEQNRGTISPFQAAQIASAAGIRIYGVALGKRGAFITEGGGFTELRIPVPPDPHTVGLLASQTGGKAYSATNATSLNMIYRHLGSSIESSSQSTEITSWFEAAAAILFIAGLGAARMWGGALP